MKKKEPTTTKNEISHYLLSQRAFDIVQNLEIHLLILNDRLEFFLLVNQVYLKIKLSIYFLAI